MTCFGCVMVLAHASIERRFSLASRGWQAGQKKLSQRFQKVVTLPQFVHCFRDSSDRQ